MLTPEGQAAGKMDKIMLLAMWANHLRKAKATEEREVIIAAGMGRPTYPLNAHTREFLANFWSTHSGEAIGYGHPQGDIEARRLMASAMSSWYANPINDNNILFTVGGAGSLKSIFAALKTIHADTPNFRVITPFPYYTLYADNGLKLHPIDVMQNTGYRLTAESLRKSLESAHQLAKTDRGEPRAFLLCDPSNPLGTVLGREELEKIAIVLREYPKLNIILDEAYAEMVLDGEKHVSLLTVAPDLKDRIIIMRSATKGLSAAGERMAITMAFDDKIMSTILKNSISTYGHAPRSLQIAYAETMSKFNDTDRRRAIDFYRPKVEYVSTRLAQIGAAMPDSEYKSEGTFYVLADFSDLLGASLSEATYSALNKRGKISTDEDITYSLLFDDQVMIAPLSYFGVAPNKGYMRITCSGSAEELEALMGRLEARLILARQAKLEILRKQLLEKLPILQQMGEVRYHDLIDQLNHHIARTPDRCSDLKEHNIAMKKLLLHVNLEINKASIEGKAKAATVITAYSRGYLARQKRKKIAEALDEEWYKFIDKFSGQSTKTRAHLESLTPAERLEFVPWKQHIKQMNQEKISPNFFMQIMTSPSMKLFGGLLLLAGIASLIAGSCGLASIPIAAIIVGAIFTTTGIGTTTLGIFPPCEKKHGVASEYMDYQLLNNGKNS